MWWLDSVLQGEFSCFVSLCSPAVVQLNCASHHPDNYLVEGDNLPYISLSLSLQDFKCKGDILFNYIKRLSLCS